MKLAVEISLYPLDQDYIPHIQAFIDSLNHDSQLYVNTTKTSTLVSGEYDHLMQVLQTQMKISFEKVGQAIFVCKFLNANNMSFDD